MLHRRFYFALAGFVSSVQSQSAQISLTPNEAFVAQSTKDALQNDFSRWAISRKDVSRRRRRHQRQPLSFPSLGQIGGAGIISSLLGLVEESLGPVVDVVKTVVLDPSFGGNVVRASGERGDTEWLGTLSFGSPPQYFKVNFDTGSSDTFLFDSSCTTCALQNHTSFNTASSSTFANVSIPWSTFFADGSNVHGYVSEDSAWTSGDTRSSVQDGILQVSDFKFALATSISMSLRKSSASGLLGLGQDALMSIHDGSTLLSRLVRGSSLKEDLLGIRLVKGQRGANGSGTIGNGGGEYSFGELKTKWIIGAGSGLTWLPVISTMYWGFIMSDVQMSVLTVLDSKTPKRAIIDTGTTLILTSQSLAAKIHSRIPKSHQNSLSTWIVPCNISSDRLSSSYAPNLFFLLGNRRFGVPIEDLAWKKIDDQGKWCVSGVQGGVEDFTVLGAMFIKNHYVALRYDGSSLSVGLGDRTDVKFIE